MELISFLLLIFDKLLILPFKCLFGVAYAKFFFLCSFILLMFFVEFFLLIVLVRENEIERKSVFIEVVHKVPEEIFSTLTFSESFQVKLVVIAHQKVLQRVEDLNR